MLPAPAAPYQLAGACAFLEERNGPAVRERIRAGVTDENTLMDVLCDWPHAMAGPDAFPIMFLGLVLTLGCSFDPRCLYCNQEQLPQRMDMPEWKAVIAEAARPAPPYVYLTGGEPLVLGEDVWGEDGLIVFATRLGCAVNVNSNAALINPRVAMELVRSGLSKIHISVDSVEPETQSALFRGADRVEAVWDGILNLQIAREAMGTRHPEIHINCVLTRLNLFQASSLVRRLTEVRRLPSGETVAEKIESIACRDFAFHLIPVGGQSNAIIRPTSDEWRRFYTETWVEIAKAWDDYQAGLEIPAGNRKSIESFAPFASPYHRVHHDMPLERYCDLAGDGTYWQGALADRCYLAPTQAYVLPDGSQHWCGGHAIRRPDPMGSVLNAPLRETIRRCAPRLSSLPGPACAGCAGATCVINQSMRNELQQKVRARLTEDEGCKAARW
jgi:hypothetical protein